MTKREIANQFRRAARILETRGWCKGTVYSDDGKFCAIGALGKAVYPKMGKDRAKAVWCSTNPRIKDACSFAVKILRSEGVENKYLWSWNDFHVKSYKEVVRFFRKCAYLLDHGAKL